jgi:hypothetical protein
MADLKMNCSAADSFLVEAIPVWAILQTIWKSERDYETALEVLVPLRRTAELLFPNRGSRFRS